MNYCNYLILIILLLLAACKKELDLDTIPCQQKVEISEPFFLSEVAKSTLPYNGFVKEYLTDVDGEIGFEVSINIPVLMPELFFILPKSSDCERNGGTIEYLFQAEEKLTFIDFTPPATFTINPPVMLIQVGSIFTDEVDNFEKSHEFIGFYVGRNSIDFSGNKTRPEGEPTWYISLDHNDLDSNKTFTHYPTITLNNKEYTDIYSNAAPLNYQSMEKIFYSLSDGLVAIEDDKGNHWTIE